MKKLLAPLLLLPSLALATPSGYGTCTKATTVTTASTSVLSSTNSPPAGRHYMLIENIGANPAYCVVGNGVAATTTNGFLLPASGGAFQLFPFEGPNGVFFLAPGDDIHCISTGGDTTIVSCDY